MSVDAKRNSLRWGVGSGMRSGERWQLGLVGQDIMRRRGWEVRALE